MNITIGKPCAVSETGGRLNNEDTIFPQPETLDSQQSLFLVCDGVGGAEKGEIASSLACEAFNNYFTTFLSGNPTDVFIQKAIQYTEIRFDDYVKQHPESTGMATTFTMVYIGSNGITLAHIGDTRIYHIRKGEILFRTEDHSLLNSWIKLGKITPEEAQHHPQKHVILKAIQRSDRPAEPDIARIRDLESGDYLFMCSDGVLEQLTDKQLAQIFAAHPCAEDIKNEIVSVCHSGSRDNYSFYIIPVQQVTESPNLKQNILSLLYSFV